MWEGYSTRCKAAGMNMDEREKESVEIWMMERRSCGSAAQILDKNWVITGHDLEDVVGPTSGANRGTLHS